MTYQVEPLAVVLLDGSICRRRLVCKSRRAEDGCVCARIADRLEELANEVRRLKQERDGVEVSEPLPRVGKIQGQRPFLDRDL